MDRIELIFPKEIYENQLEHLRGDWASYILTEYEDFYRIQVPYEKRFIYDSEFFTTDGSQIYLNGMLRNGLQLNYAYVEKFFIGLKFDLNSAAAVMEVMRHLLPHSTNLVTTNDLVHGAIGEPLCTGVTYGAGWGRIKLDNYAFVDTTTFQSQGWRARNRIFMEVEVTNATSFFERQVCAPEMMNHHIWLQWLDEISMKTLQWFTNTEVVGRIAGAPFQETISSLQNGLV